MKEIATNLKKGDKGKSRARKASPSSYLAQLRSPLIFFGLALLLIESSFGACLLRYAFSEHTVTILACWMAVLFIIAIVAVSILTYKVPRHLMLEFQTNTTEEVAAKMRRIRKAITAVLQFSQRGTNDPESVMQMLGEVESLFDNEGSAQIEKGEGRDGVRSISTSNL